MLFLLSLLLLPAVLAHNITSSTLSARGGLRFSNYYAGADEGACGEWHQDSEYVVALTQLEWNNGANCGKEVYITYNGMSAVAKIVDECEECPFGALDFSQALFGHFVGGEQNNLEVGYIYGDWSYGTGPSGGDSGGDDTTTTTTTKKAAPITTTSHTTTSTTSTTSTTTTSTHTTTSSKTATTSASHSTSKSTSAATSTSTSASTSAPSTSVAAGQQNLRDFTQALLDLSGFLVQAVA